jgi:hypothetical protein
LSALHGTDARTFEIGVEVGDDRLADVVTLARTSNGNLEKR